MLYISFIRRICCTFSNWDLINLSSTCQHEISLNCVVYFRQLLSCFQDVISCWEMSEDSIIASGYLKLEMLYKVYIPRCFMQMGYSCFCAKVLPTLLTIRNCTLAGIVYFFDFSTDAVPTTRWRPSWSLWNWSTWKPTTWVQFTDIYLSGQGCQLLRPFHGKPVYRHSHCGTEFTYDSWSWGRREPDHPSSQGNVRCLL